MLKDVKKRVSAIIYIRVVVVTILLGSFYIFRIGYDKLSHPEYFSYFIAFLYFLTIIYAMILKWIRGESRFISFAYIQIIIDIIAETVLIYMTGGIESMFSFLFPLSIISAAIILNRRACYIMATLSSILYGVLLDLQFYKVIHTNTGLIFSEKDYFYNIFAHVTANYLIAFLSGYLSERLDRATRSLEERDSVLNDLKAFSEYVVESMPSGVFTTDLERRIVLFNSSAKEITRLDESDVIGKRPEEIFPFLDNSKFFYERTEGEIMRDGKPVPVGIRISSLKDASGNHIGLIGVFQDLTQLKEMEAEVKRKEKWAVIGELSASIAHELRNPLASLKGSIEMLREKKVPQAHADRLMSIALSEMDRLNGIITEFLIYARPKELNREKFDVIDPLKEVITMLKSHENGDKHINITSNLDDGEIISGDAKQLKQVFWNLCVNAVDAISEDGHINIYTHRENDRLEVVFEDDGEGVDTKDLDRIFYPFFTTKEKGTGLGLAIAQKIVEEHGGKIIARSGGNGEGMTFRVSLPAEGE